MKNKNTATLLAIFTGIIGGHRFYLGQFGLGMLYLVSSWTFVPLFLGILDALVFLFQSDERFCQWVFYWVHRWQIGKFI